MPSNNESNKENRGKGSTLDNQKGIFLDRSAKKKILLATLVLLTIILVFAALQPIVFLFTNTQANSQLGILGPNKTISGYPTNIVANQSFLLYGYLVNQEGNARYYNILVKLGNQDTPVSNTTYANAPVITEYYHALDNNQTYVFPMNLTISQTGIQERLIFELWIYEPSSSSWSYTGVFDQLWLNVASS
jgi:uncharacterized membrane protein